MTDELRPLFRFEEDADDAATLRAGEPVVVLYGSTYEREFQRARLLRIGRRLGIVINTRARDGRLTARRAP